MLILSHVTMSIWVYEYSSPLSLKFCGSMTVNQVDLVTEQKKFYTYSPRWKTNHPGNSLWATHISFGAPTKIHRQWKRYRKIEAKTALSHTTDTPFLLHKPDEVRRCNEKKSAQLILKPSQDDTWIHTGRIAKQKPGWWRRKEEKVKKRWGRDYFIDILGANGN